MFSKERKRAFIAKVVPPLGYVLIRLLHLTCKKRYVVSEKLPQENFIVAFWHGELLFQPFLYRKIKKPKITVMISDHFDGELIAKTISYFGFETIRGSSSKGAARVLLNALKMIEKGYEVAITPDGPRGPRHSVADGIVALAKKSKKPIVVFRTKCLSSWKLKSWDRFEIPKPFSTIEQIARDPFYIDDMEFEDARALIKEEMLKDG